MNRTRRRLLTTVAVLAGLIVITGLSQPAQPQEEADAGRAVFAANCAMCHGEDARGMMGMHPSLRGAVDRLTYDGVEVTIRNGRNTNPPMPAFGDELTDDQIDDVIAYLASFPPGPRNFGPGDDGGMMDGGMMDGGMMPGGGSLVVMALVAAVILAGILAAVVFVVRRRPPASPTPAREELDRRYAAGELTRDEYLERRRDLE